MEVEVRRGRTGREKVLNVEVFNKSNIEGCIIRVTGIGIGVLKKELRRTQVLESEASVQSYTYW